MRKRYVGSKDQRKKEKKKERERKKEEKKKKEEERRRRRKKVRKNLLFQSSMKKIWPNRNAACNIDVKQKSRSPVKYISARLPETSKPRTWRGVLSQPRWLP